MPVRLRQSLARMWTDGTRRCMQMWASPAQMWPTPVLIWSCQVQVRTNAAARVVRWSLVGMTSPDHIRIDPMSMWVDPMPMCMPLWIDSMSI